MTGSPPPETKPAPDRRDTGLLRVVGLLGLSAAIVNVTIGGGIFRLPSAVYAQLGGGSPAAYVICAVMMGLVVTCFAEAGSRVPLTGGLYAYIEVAFGPLIGFVSGFLLWAGMSAALSAVAVFFGDAVGALFPSLSGQFAHGAVVVSAIALLAGLNLFGVGNAARFNTVMTVTKLMPLVLVIVFGLGSLSAERIGFRMPSPAPLARGSVFLIFAFLGVESALVPSGEVRDAARTVPRAIAIALSVVVVVYMLVQLVTQVTLGGDLASSKTPVADAAWSLMGGGGRTIILAGTAISMFGYVSGMTLAVPRMLFAFGRDGFGVRQLAAVHERYRTPHVAIAVQALINVGLATTGTFEQLAIAANGSVLLVYAVCAIAVLVLRKRNVRTETAPFVAPLGGAVPILAFASILWLLLSLTLSEWAALGIVTGVAFAIFAATRQTRQTRQTRMERATR